MEGANTIFRVLWSCLNYPFDSEPFHIHKPWGLTHRMPAWIGGAPKGTSIKTHASANHLSNRCVGPMAALLLPIRAGWGGSGGVGGGGPAHT